MSQENVEVFRQSLDAFDRRDRASWLALRDTNCEVIPTATWPEADAIRGREAAWGFYLQAADAFERVPVDDAELVDAGPDMIARRFQASIPVRAFSRFSCDIAYSRSPAASRAFSGSRKARKRITLPP